MMVLGRVAPPRSTVVNTAVLVRFVTGAGVVGLGLGAVEVTPGMPVTGSIGPGEGAGAAAEVFERSGQWVLYAATGSSAHGPEPSTA